MTRCIKSVFIILGFAILSACKLNSPIPDCTIPTEIQDIEFGTLQYQAITTKYLTEENPSNYRYFFKTFHESNGKTYMTTNFRNSNTCFDVDILVENWDKLAEMKKTNGISYPKELVKLKWTLQQSKENTEVVYQNMNTIID